jgi:hypothetical protein
MLTGTAMHSWSADLALVGWEADARRFHCGGDLVGFQTGTRAVVPPIRRGGGRRMGRRPTPC